MELVRVEEPVVTIKLTYKELIACMGALRAADNNDVKHAAYTEMEMPFEQSISSEEQINLSFAFEETAVEVIKTLVK